MRKPGVRPPWARGPGALRHRTGGRGSGEQPAPPVVLVVADPAGTGKRRLPTCSTYSFSASRCRPRSTGRRTLAGRASTPGRTGRRRRRRSPLSLRPPVPGRGRCVGSHVPRRGGFLVAVAWGRDEVLGKEIGAAQHQPTGVGAPTAPGPPADRHSRGSYRPERPPLGSFRRPARVCVDPPRRSPTECSHVGHSSRQRGCPCSFAPPREVCGDFLWPPRRSPSSTGRFLPLALQAAAPGGRVEEPGELTMGHGGEPEAGAIRDEVDQPAHELAVDLARQSGSHGPSGGEHQNPCQPGDEPRRQEAHSSGRSSAAGHGADPRRPAAWQNGLRGCRAVPILGAPRIVPGRDAGVWSRSRTAPVAASALLKESHG